MYFGITCFLLFFFFLYLLTKFYFFKFDKKESLNSLFHAVIAPPLEYFCSSALYARKIKKEYLRRILEHALFDVSFINVGIRNNVKIDEVL